LESDHQPVTSFRYYETQPELFRSSADRRDRSLLSGDLGLVMNLHLHNIILFTIIIHYRYRIKVEIFASISKRFLDEYGACDVMILFVYVNYSHNVGIITLRFH